MTLLTLMTLLVARALLLWLPLLKNRNLQTSLLIVANRPDLGSVNKIFSSRFNTLLWLFDMQGCRKWGCMGCKYCQDKEAKPVLSKDFVRIFAPPEFQTFHRPWYDLESATDSATHDIIMCVHGKGGLISESFSLLSSKVPNHCTVST